MVEASVAAARRAFSSAEIISSVLLRNQSAAPTSRITIPPTIAAVKKALPLPDVSASLWSSASSESSPTISGPS